MKILVAGGGKVGYYLTKALLEEGHELHLIEKDPVAAQKIAAELDIPVVCGDAASVDILEGCGIQSPDAVLALTGSDEDNLVCCQLASRIFYKAKIVSKVNDPKNVTIFKRLGIGTAISNVDTFVKLLEREVDTSRIKELLEVGEDASIHEITLPKVYELSGTSLSELKLPADSIIISITRAGHLIIPRGNTKLMDGDRLLVMAHDRAVSELLCILKLDRIKGV